MDSLIMVLLWFQVLLLWLFFVGPYHSYRVDLLRQRLFTLRDDLFQNATDGKFSFEDPAYTTTRSTLNGMIRFSNQISLIHYITFNFFDEKQSKEFGAAYIKSLEENISKLSEEGAEIIEASHRQMNLEVCKHIVHTSILLVTIFFITKSLSRVLNKANYITCLFKRNEEKFYPLDAEAHDIGSSARHIAYS